MANNENELPLPATIAEQNVRQTQRHLPQFFRTDANKKFLGGTMDPLTQPGVLRRINSYVGRKDIPNYDPADNYISESSTQRQNYQLEPAFVSEDPVTGEVNWYADYIDYMNALRYFGANVSNHSKFNKQEAYSWNPHVDWDKLVNYREYYWLPSGPDSITIYGHLESTTSTFTITSYAEGDNVAYLFSPDGLTVNPRLTLYRGIKYRFEINTPGKPFSIKTQPKIGESFFYDTGVSKRNVEVGFVEFTVPYEAPDLLYYVDNKDPETAGMIDIRDIRESAFLDVESEIVGKRDYTSSTGIKFVNGLKIEFTGQITPTKYADGFWYVEGVGEKINLVKTSDLETPAVYGSGLDVPFDDQPFDSLPWDNADNFPQDKDYIVINRTSRDRNTWTRNNRWFHRTVLETTANANNQVANLDQASRASRPIIEFEPDLKLFNYGYMAKKDVDLVDTVTTDVFSTIEGSVGYIVDGEYLYPGYRVLFTADPDILVNGRIFEVKYIFNANQNRRQITLQEVDETDPIDGEVVYITKGGNKGSSYYYENGAWTLAQKKTKVNQAPLFDLFDENQISYSDKTNYSYNNFPGNRIFGYKIGTGTVDPYLGFAISYRNINNIGDIEFEFDLQKQSWTYLEKNVLASVDSFGGFLRKWTPEGNFKYSNGWIQTNKNTEQSVARVLIVNTSTDLIPVDVYDNSANLTDIKVRVYVNNVKRTDVSAQIIEKTFYIKFATPLSIGDKVVYKVNSVGRKNLKGYYEIPINWQNNPLNDTVDGFTFGEVIDHVRTIIEGVSSFSGDFPGIGNLANIGPVSQFGRKFMQHTGPMSIAAFAMIDKDANVVKALRWAARKYTEFQKEFLRIANTTAFDGPIYEIVDQILSEYSKAKYIEISAFYFSDMAPFGAASVREYQVVDPRLPVFVIDSIYTPLSQNKRTIIVYLNNEQLLLKKDYDFDPTDAFVIIRRPLAAGDQILIKDYASTDGCYIPFTPSKLGIYPIFEPMIYLDDTYRESTLVIQCHDGSIMKAYGDYRDDLILELERRIFNSRRVDYDPDIFNLDDVLPGYYRRGDFTKAEIDDIMLREFLRWNSIPSFDFNVNDYFIEDEPFTYNYNRSTAPNGAEPLYGFWRGIYKYFYDTDRPHTHPWEIQGFKLQPAWWEDVYGPAPYTSENKILWDNIEQGIISDPAGVRTETTYARPGMSNYLPVDANGNLLSPLDSNLSQNFALINAKGRFSFADQGPVETAWRRSSEYPYAVMITMCVLRGAEFIGKFWDRFTIKRNIAGQIYNTLTDKKVRPADLPFSDEYIDQNTNILTSGLTNIIDEYVAIERYVNFDYYKTLMRSLSVKLSYRVGAFTSKQKIKVLLDSRSPNASGTVFLPDENYKIFYNKSAPVDTINYSGVIIEKKNNGFSVKGYDNEKNYFEIFPPRIIRSDSSFNVGGISESFVDWEGGKYFTRGQIARVGEEFYKSKISHTASANFGDDADKWIRLAKLPLTGGRDAIRRTRFDDSPIRIPYGTTFADIQSIVDFLLGYQERLRAWGFEFEDFSKNLEVPLNWLTSAKEFMFWTLQNWSAGSVITLSPAANNLKFKPKITASIDNLDTDFYEYAIFKADGSPLKSDLTNVYREDNGFEIKPVSTNDGIFHVRTNLVYREHVMLFDNVSIFNDIIYDVVPGYRQGRLKLVGFKTDNWDGGFTVPGFLYDEAKIIDWDSNTDYNLGDIVRYQNYYFSAIKKVLGKVDFDYTDWKQLSSQPTAKLIPNFDYKIEQFRDFYNLEGSVYDTTQQALARHLVGYQKREYLENIIIDDVAQYKFYQGFVKEKGTLNSVNKLFDALRSSGFSSIDIKEEWAFKVGDFGASEAYTELEFPLDEEKFRFNPQDVVLTVNKAEFEDLTIYNVPTTSVDIKPSSYDAKPFTMVGLDHSQDDYGVFKYRVAGYVKDEDVDHIIFDEATLFNYDITLLNNRDKIWLGNTNDGDWDVLEHFNTNILITDWSAADNAIVLHCSETPNVVVNDIVVLRNLDILDGMYKVQRVYNNRIEVFTYNTALFKVDDLSTSGVLYKLQSIRYSSPAEISNRLYNQTDIQGEMIWVDHDKSNNWLVLENKKAFTVSELPAYLKVADQLHGYEIKISENKLFMFVTAINYTGGKVIVYSRPNNQSKWVFLQTIVMPPNLSTYSGTEQFGASIDVSSDGSLLVISAPNLSSMRSYFRGNYMPSAIYQKGEVVRYNDKLWMAKQTINGDGSTITVETQDWEPATYYSYRARPTHYVGDYNPLTDYVPGDTVTFNSAVWRNVTAVKGDEFNTIIGSDKWELNESLDEQRADGTGTVYTNQGGVFVFYYDVYSRLYKEETVLGSYDPQSNEKFGNKIRLSYDGTTTWLFVAANNYNSDTGRVHVFKKDINGWQFNEQLYLDFTNVLGLYPSIYSPTTGSKYGYDLDINDGATKIAVSAPFLGSGAVYIFNRNGTSFELIEVIDSYTLINGIVENLIGGDSYLSENDLFGYSIRLRNDSLFVSCPNDDIRGFNVGSVYHFDYVGADSSGNPYRLIQLITPPTVLENERFGTKIDISPNGKLLAVSSIGGNSVIETTFDHYSDRLVFNADSTSNYILDTSSSVLTGTTFDSKGTTFFDRVAYTGAVYTYNRFDDNYIYGEKLIPSGMLYTDDNFGFSMEVTNDSIAVGTPKRYLSGDRLGTVFIFDYSELSWSTKQSQNSMVDITKFKKAFIYDTDLSVLVNSLDFIDPAKGKIAGVADQEIRYQTYYDPAIYEYGIDDNTAVDRSAPWTSEHVGEIWWDLSKVKYTWYEQGDSSYRNTNWGRIFPGSSVDIYEWVETTYLPSQWAKLADTEAGLAIGISGTPKDVDDFTYSSAFKYDEMTESKTTIYYYWVKNKTIVPRNSFRTLAASDIRNMILDPKSQGYKYVAVTGENSLSLVNITSKLKHKHISLNLQFFVVDNTDLLTHREYALIAKDDPTSKIPSIIENKWFDSLIGYNVKGQRVPDTKLSLRQRYGNSNDPRQTWFTNRFEALKQLVEYVNSVLSTSPIVDEINFANLLKSDPLPTTNSGSIDLTIDILDELRFIGTAKIKTATITVGVKDGEIVNVFITDPGYGYKVPPTIKLVGTGSGAEFVTTIDTFGRLSSVVIKKAGREYDSSVIATVRNFTVLVISDIEANNGWSVQEWNSSRKRWTRIKTQAFDVTRYWAYRDWYATGFSKDSDISYLVDNTVDLNGLPVRVGELVKINNVGYGNWLLLQRRFVSNSPDFTDDYEVVGKQNATIAFSDKLYNLNQDLGFDTKFTFDLNLYDNSPTTELRIILESIRDDILVDNFREFYVKAFFNSVHYALTEHLYIDWAFKTSFLKINHSVGTLRQRPTFQSDVLDSYQKYVEEAKPYKSKIREFVSAYDTVENAYQLTTDFDLPAYYDNDAGVIQRTTLLSENVNIYPWKNWLDNHTYEVTEITLQDGGSGYTSMPKVIISGTGTGASATAYIANGKVYKIVLDHPGAGYTETPTVFISGGNGDVDVNRAKAFAIIGNSKVRTNLISMKYDRYLPYYSVNSFSIVENNFVGTGSKTTFKLKYAPEVEKSKFTIIVDSVEYYGSQYDVSIVEAVHDTYTALEGYIVFKTAPAVGAIISITYYKNIKLYSAADRINYAYSPTTGQYGKDLGQLMQGVDYGGVQITSIDFDIGGGWDVLPWDVTSWDNVLDSNDDYVVASDGTTRSFDLPYIPAVGEIVNIYVNGVRIDDPYFSIYDGSTEQLNGLYNAPSGTVMDSFVGNGTTRVITIPEIVDLMPDDILTFRKSTSDGTILPTDRSLIDSFISGGDLSYATAKGVTAEEIAIDGDGLVTVDTSHGPEELVQGQVVDTLDINVYHSPAAGGPNVYIRNFTGNGVTNTFNLGRTPDNVSGIIVLVDNVFTDFEVDFTSNNIITSSTPADETKIAIISIDTAGYDISEKTTFIGDGSTKEFLTSARYNGGNVSGFITINGVAVSFTIKESDASYEVPGNIVIVFDIAPSINDVIQVMLFLGTVQKWSEVTEEIIPVVPGQFSYTLTTVPATLGPLSAMVLVVIDNAFLQAPDYEYYTYDGSVLFISDIRYPPNTLRPQDVDVYVNGMILTPVSQYVLDSSQVTITISPDAANDGDLVTVEINKKADYRVIGNQLVLNSTNYSTNNKNTITITTFTNHDIYKVENINIGFRFNTGFDVLQYDITKYDTLSAAINTSGIFNLPRTVSDFSGVFVSLNRLLLSPNVDYVVLDNRKQIKVILPDLLGGSDFIEIITFNDRTVRPSYGFKIFKDMINRVHYKRLDSSASTALKEPLTYLDTRIIVHDGSVLAEPSRQNNLPGVVVIEGERIEYLVKEGDTLRQIRRGTLGTGVKNFYPTGTPVDDFGPLQTVPYTDQEIKKVVYGDGTSKVIDLDFVPTVTYGTIDDGSTYYNGWYRDTIPSNYGQCDMIEVFVSGRRLNKTPYTIYDQELGQDSYNGAGDKQVEAEFSVDGETASVRLTETPDAGATIVVVRKVGRIWQKIDENASLVFSGTDIARFLTAKQVNLPK